jgi:hypothetical protein
MTEKLKNKLKNVQRCDAINIYFLEYNKTSFRPENYLFQKKLFIPRENYFHLDKFFPEENLPGIITYSRRKLLTPGVNYLFQEKIIFTGE